MINIKPEWNQFRKDKELFRRIKTLLQIDEMTIKDIRN